MMRLVAFLIIMLFPTYVLGEESIVMGIDAGEQAPFDGVLMNDVAVAKIIAEKEEAESLCMLEVEKQLTEQVLKCKLDTDFLQTSLDAEKQRFAVMIEVREDEVRALHDVLEKEGTDDIWWFVGGTAIGSFVVGSVFAIVMVVD